MVSITNTESKKTTKISFFPVVILLAAFHQPSFFFFSSRVHCFHYLIPLTKQGNYAIVANVESMDYDPLVVKLNKDISAIEEAMGAALQQHKFQYIFEGQWTPENLKHEVSGVVYPSKC